MGKTRAEVAQQNAAKLAELFGEGDAFTFDLPLKDGTTFALALYAPTTREVMELIASVSNSVELAQKAIDLVCGEIDLPANRMTPAGYQALKAKCFDLCCFLAGPDDGEGKDSAKPQEGDSGDPLPLT